LHWKELAILFFEIMHYQVFLALEEHGWIIGLEQNRIYRSCPGSENNSLLMKA
jgi:hypothetical protein